MDRIGPRLREEGITGLAPIDARAAYTVDVELWDAPTQLDRLVRVQNIVTHIEGKAGEVLSRYVGDAGLIVLRARVPGTLLRDMLSLPAIARVDRPPIPDLGERDPTVVTVADVPEPTDPGDDAPLIGIIDSGSTDHPLLAPSLQESIGVPENLGTADMWGHGTKVAGIAAFGDLRECISNNTFASPVRIISAKVVNEQGQFDDTSTIPEQMHDAIRALHERGCRVINISLGDVHRIPYMMADASHNGLRRSMRLRASWTLSSSSRREILLAASVPRGVRKPNTSRRPIRTILLRLRTASSSRGRQPSH
jgi:hypothetical protein